MGSFLDQRWISWVVAVWVFPFEFDLLWSVGFVFKDGFPGWSSGCSPNTKEKRNSWTRNWWKFWGGVVVVFWLQVVPGRAGGGSFKRKKNHIAEKEFAYRMCARWPTIAMSKFCLGLNEAFAVAWLRCHDLLSSDVASCEMICGTTPVLLCTTKNYNVLLQDYSVLLCTTKYYASTTLFYKVILQYYQVLRQYYSVLQSIIQSITPVLQCRTPVLQSTTPVLLSTTPVLLCTTKYYASATLFYKVLLQYY